MSLKKSHKYLYLFLIHLSAFGIVSSIKHGSVAFFTSDLIYFSLYLLVSFFSSLISKKVSDKKGALTFFVIFKPYLNSFVLSCGILGVLFLLPFGLSPSRLLFSGTLFLSFSLEIIFVYLNYTISVKRHDRAKIKFNVMTLVVFFILLLFVGFFVYFTTDSGYFERDQWGLLLVLLLWFTTGILIHNFQSFRSKRNIWRSIWTHIKANIYFLSLLTYAIFILRPELSLSLKPIEVALYYSITAPIVAAVLFLLFRPDTTDEVKTGLFTATEIVEKNVVEASNTVREKGIYTYCYNLREDGQLFNELKDIYLKKYQEVFSFISEFINLNSFDPSRARVIRSANTYNVEILPENSMEFYMNLHKINDFRLLNQYFSMVNSCLKDRGLFIGVYEPTRLRYRRFIRKYPYYISKLFYFLDFIWKRVLPKLPIIRKFYSALSRGVNRPVSMAENLGRLHFCGFEIIALHEIDNLQYFIAQKVSSPSLDKFPSYGVLFKMKRKGKEGKEIFVYKLRTMYPYSEYIQKFLYEIQGLKHGGKIKDDIRITSWGRVFRKLWIDELPMLLNWLKGEMKLVGVRPLSTQYFNLYRDSLKEKRIKYKPGLVPPFYADLPKTLDEIMDSEERYLDLYEKHPIITDVKYFFKAFTNIVFRSARSS